MLLSSLLKEIDRQEKASWRLDQTRSFARVTITPIVEDGERYFEFNEALEIKPYPNQLGFGGLWGSGVAKDRAEVDRLIADFRKDWVEPYGLERVEIIEEPETNRVGWVNRRRADALREAGKAEDHRSKSAQLSLL